MVASIKIKRGTRSQLTTAAGSNGLKQGELYLVTDENRLAVGLSASTSESFAKQSEASGGGISEDDSLALAIAL